MNASEILLVLVSLFLAAHTNAAYTMLRPKFVRQARSWRTIPSNPQPAYQEPAYYPAYDDMEPVEIDYSVAIPNDYFDEPGSNLPIGQETWFEAEKSKVNDAFMQNLMQLYRHEPAQQQQEQYYPYEPHYSNYDQYYMNDEQQLKLLKRANDLSPSTVAPALAAATRAPAHQGQKEVAMLRPPSPPKGHAEVKPTAHPSSVYDAIKRLLTIQDLQEGQSHIKKRFAPSEESLVKQLNGLKKMSA
ncbi:uncharacterized protein LOC132195163 [Neocloeon triangulifer]|uniref:uncharacterized protein LOC132195163 n=1 Tax=Neocloeon triangulifer TaxID=2078957 RepID=UPI00286F3309|nr:uncharacterized protein LOC132195163 [Neocloeon triangulifer]